MWGWQDGKVRSRPVVGQPEVTEAGALLLWADPDGVTIGGTLLAAFSPAGWLSYRLGGDGGEEE